MITKSWTTKIYKITSRNLTEGKYTKYDHKISPVSKFTRYDHKIFYKIYMITKSHQIQKFQDIKPCTTKIYKIWSQKSPKIHIYEKWSQNFVPQIFIRYDKISTYENLQNKIPNLSEMIKRWDITKSHQCQNS